MQPPPTALRERLRRADPDAMDADELDGLLADISSERAWLDALEVRATRRQRALAAEGRAADPRSSLARHGRRSGKDARAANDREAVCTSMPAVEDALACGTVSAGHVDAIAGATRNLDNATRAEFADRADELVEQAAESSVDAFGRQCRELARDLAAQHADDSEADEFERQRAASEVTRWTDRETGMCHTHIEMDPESDRRFWSAIQRQRGLLRRRTANRTTSWDRLTVDAVVTAVSGGSGNGGAPATSMLVLADLATITDGRHPGSVCETDAGTPLSVATMRRLACEAELIPVVLDGDGVVLDEGRAKRLATTEQRMAITAMHRTCVHPECEVSVDDCRIHHTEEWTRDQGATDLDVLAPVCEEHHHLVHEGGWHLRLGEGRVATWIRPDGVVHWSGPTVDRPRRTA